MSVLIVKLSAWQEFHQKIVYLECRQGYVWRRQRKDANWPLRSSFDREVKSENESERAKKLKLHLETFKTGINRSYPMLLPSREEEIWALGRD
jgi:hypothetical protein